MQASKTKPIARHCIPCKKSQGTQQKQLKKANELPPSNKKYHSKNEC
jgi:hypothetical protein